MFINAVEPARVVLYLNNIRMRSHFTEAVCSTLPAGTTSNEQRHSVFGQLLRTTSRITLELLERLLLLIVIREMGVSVGKLLGSSLRRYRHSLLVSSWALNLTLFNQTEWEEHRASAPLTTPSFRTNLVSIVVTKKKRRMLSEQDPIQRDPQGRDIFLELVNGGILVSGGLAAVRPKPAGPVPPHLAARDPSPVADPASDAAD